MLVGRAFKEWLGWHAAICALAWLYAWLTLDGLPEMGMPHPDFPLPILVEISEI